MGQIVSNRTGRVKIFHSGVYPEIVIKAEQKKECLIYRAELNLDPKQAILNTLLAIQDSANHLGPKV